MLFKQAINIVTLLTSTLVSFVLSKDNSEYSQTFLDFFNNIPNSTTLISCPDFQELQCDTRTQYCPYSPFGPPECGSCQETCNPERITSRDRVIECIQKCPVYVNMILKDQNSPVVFADRFFEPMLVFLIWALGGTIIIIVWILKDIGCFKYGRSLIPVSIMSKENFEQDRHPEQESPPEVVNDKVAQTARPVHHSLRSSIV